jgi:hypothetical protein
VPQSASSSRPLSTPPSATFLSLVVEVCPPLILKNRVLTLQCHYIYISSNATGSTLIRVGSYGACAIREISIKKPSRSRLPSTPMLCIGLSVVVLMPWVWAVSATELTLEG